MTRTTLVTIALASILIGTWALLNHRALLGVAALAVATKALIAAYRIPA